MTTHGGAVGDSTSVGETLPAAGEAVAEQIAESTTDGLRLLSTINAFYLPRCSLPGCRSRPHRTHVGESSMREIADLDTGC